MSNITKNLLLALTLVGVIALIVFSIQLIILNRGVEPADSGATISGGSQGDEDPDNTENGYGTDGLFDPNPNTPRPPPQGTRRDPLVAENTRLVIYSSDDWFDFEQSDFDWLLTYKGEGNASLRISFTSITQGVAAHAEDYLNNYSGSSTSEYTGEQAIHGSPVIGYHVTTQAGGSVYEAWIVNLDDSDVALVLIITYQNDQQKDALYLVLSSLDIERTPT